MSFNKHGRKANWGSLALSIYPDAASVARTLAPTEPVLLTRGHAARRAARYFVEHFPGKVLYAVKANPTPALLRELWAGGVRHFDTASIREVRLVKEVLGPEAECCFMHPVKAREAIAEAYHHHGVRAFSLDSHEELAKIVVACQGADGTPADDLTLCVRLKVSSDYAQHSLAAKFGVAQHDAPVLLQAARQAADSLGVCFHVGSQAMSPAAYVEALERARTAIVAAAVVVDVVNVGGGFPSAYPGMEPLPLADYFKAIDRAAEDLPVSYASELWCEPGRALAAEYQSVIVRVEHRRGHELYLNDGGFGTLYDAANLGWRFPVRRLAREAANADYADFAFYGPTCDDADFMPGPFALPADIAEGDLIEVGMIGAYGAALASGFNGFGAAATVAVADEPMASLYREVPRPLRAGADDRKVTQLRGS